MYSLSFTGFFFFLTIIILKIFGRHQESNPGPLVKRTSALPLSYDNQPANKHSNSVFILFRGIAMLQSHSQQTNENSLF